jgi:hypothetical protein
MTSFVRIALAGAGSFAIVDIMDIVEGDTIGHLAERACVKFSFGRRLLTLYCVITAGLAAGEALPCQTPYLFFGERERAESERLSRSACESTW